VATDARPKATEIRLIQQVNANDPAVGYDRWPKHRAPWSQEIVAMKRMPAYQSPYRCRYRRSGDVRWRTVEALQAIGPQVPTVEAWKESATDVGMQIADRHRRILVARDAPQDVQLHSGDRPSRSALCAVETWLASPKESSRRGRADVTPTRNQTGSRTGFLITR